MHQDLNKHWSYCYDQGRDFRLIGSLTITKFLGFTNEHAPKTALDIGCGTGQLTRELWHRGYKAVGLDVSESAIKTARSLTIVPDTELMYQRADIEQYDVASLPFQPYGLITCKLVYAFIKDKSRFLETVNTLLAPDGIFVVITPLTETTPAEKQSIAATQDDTQLLSQHFRQIAWYEEQGSGYFVGGKV